MGILIRILVNAIGLYATTFVPGIGWHGNLVQLIVAGAILGLFNLIVKPLAMLISLPLPRSPGAIGMVPPTTSAQWSGRSVCVLCEKRLLVPREENNYEQTSYPRHY